MVLLQAPLAQVVFRRVLTTPMALLAQVGSRPAPTIPRALLARLGSRLAPTAPTAPLVQADSVVTPPTLDRMTPTWPIRLILVWTAILVRCSDPLAAGMITDDLVDRSTHGTHGTTTGTGLSHNTHGTTGTSGLSSGTTGAGYGNTSTNAGPHSSNLANKTDPRVDSDLGRLPQLF